MLYMRSKAWLATHVSLRLTRLPRTESTAQRSRRLRSTRADVPVLLVHADATNNNYFSMGPERRYPAVPVRGEYAPTKSPVGGPHAAVAAADSSTIKIRSTIDGNGNPMRAISDHVRQ